MSGQVRLSPAIVLSSCIRDGQYLPAILTFRQEHVVDTAMTKDACPIKGIWDPCRRHITVNAYFFYFEAFICNALFQLTDISNES